MNTFTPQGFARDPVPQLPLPGGKAIQEWVHKLRRRLVASFTRLYPLYSGCGTMANCRLVRFLAGEPVGFDWVRLRQGPYLRVMLGDYLSNAVYFSRDWDRKISWICQRLLRPGDIALDIGANLGVVTCQIAALVGQQGQVHSFEPNPVLVDLLQQSIHANQFSNVHLNSVALGRDEQEVDLTVPIDNHCLGTLARQAKGRKIRVPVTTLSHWFETSGVTQIRLMKLDVEGFEEQVLEGGESLFNTAPPDAILFELNEYVGPFEAHPVIQFLRHHHYDFLMVPLNLLRMSVRSFSSTHQAGSPSNDLIAVRQGPAHAEVHSRLRVDR